MSQKWFLSVLTMLGSLILAGALSEVGAAETKDEMLRLKVSYRLNEGVAERTLEMKAVASEAWQDGAAVIDGYLMQVRLGEVSAKTLRVDFRIVRADAKDKPSQAISAKVNWGQRAHGTQTVDGRVYGVDFVADRITK